MMTLQILTPDNLLVDTDQVSQVSAQSEALGSFSVRSGHQPMVSGLSAGILSYKQGNQVLKVQLFGGVLETDGKTITVLTPAASII